MKKFKVTIVGNSIALRCRPQSEGSKNYGQYLEEKLIEKYPNHFVSLLNTAFSRATVTDIQQILNPTIVNQFPDVYIINLGVCDASTREIPYWYAEILNKKKDSVLRHVLRVIHDSFIRKHNSFFVKIRGKRAWISKKKFAKLYENIFIEIKRNSNAKVIALPINLPSPRVENILPGSHQKYLEYNKIIEEITARQQGITIPIDDLNSDEHYPDGAHYSDLGHQIIASRILEVIHAAI